MAIVPHHQKPEHGPVVSHALPVQLPPQAIEEFQALWEKHFGRKLPHSQAQLKAQQTFTVLRLLWEPLPKKRKDEAGSQ